MDWSQTRSVWSWTSQASYSGFTWHLFTAEWTWKVKNVADTPSHYSELRNHDPLQRNVTNCVASHCNKFWNVSRNEYSQSTWMKNAVVTGLITLFDTYCIRGQCNKEYESIKAQNKINAKLPQVRELFSRLPISFQIPQWFPLSHVTEFPFWFLTPLTNLIPPTHKALQH